MKRAEFNIRGMIFNRSSQFVCFADAMNIISRTFENVENLYTRLKRQAAKVELLALETKYMLVRRTKHYRVRLGIHVYNAEKIGNSLRVRIMDYIRREPAST